MTDEETERAIALNALRRARPRQFEVVALHLQGHGPSEIAERLGITQGTASTTLRRALDNLKNLREQAATAIAGKHNNT